MSNPAFVDTGSLVTKYLIKKKKNYAIKQWKLHHSSPLMQASMSGMYHFHLLGKQSRSNLISTRESGWSTLHTYKFPVHIPVWQQIPDVLLLWRGGEVCWKLRIYTVFSILPLYRIKHGTEPDFEIHFYFQSIDFTVKWLPGFSGMQSFITLIY